jgi:hypothetical protein
MRAPARARFFLVFPVFRQLSVGFSLRGEPDRLHPCEKAASVFENENGTRAIKWDEDRFLN